MSMSDKYYEGMEKKLYSKVFDPTQGCMVQVGTIDAETVKDIEARFKTAVTGVVNAYKPVMLPEDNDIGYAMRAVKSMAKVSRKAWCCSDYIMLNEHSIVILCHELDVGGVHTKRWYPGPVDLLADDYFVVSFS